MKKFFASLIAAFMLTAGFVAVSTAPASAACKPSQYNPCPKTSTKAVGPKVIKRGKKPVTAVNVRTAGSVKAKGVVTVRIKGPGVNKTIKVRYNGKTVKVLGPKLRKPGRYRITVTFKGTNARDSKTVRTIRVRR